MTYACFISLTFLGLLWWSTVHERCMNVHEHPLFLFASECGLRTKARDGRSVLWHGTAITHLLRILAPVTRYWLWQNEQQWRPSPDLQLVALRTMSWESINYAQGALCFQHNKTISLWYGHQATSHPDTFACRKELYHIDTVASPPWISQISP